jgi:hypothetical protein
MALSCCVLPQSFVLCTMDRDARSTRLARFNAAPGLFGQRTSIAPAPGSERLSPSVPVRARWDDIGARWRSRRSCNIGRTGSAGAEAHRMIGIAGAAGRGELLHRQLLATLILLISPGERLRSHLRLNPEPQRPAIAGDQERGTENGESNVEVTSKRMWARVRETTALVSTILSGTRAIHLLHQPG